MPLPSNPHLITNQFVGFCRHDYILPPAIPTVYFFLDYDVIHGITGLLAWPTAEYGFPPAKRPSHGEILDNGLSMEGRGTDASLIVPHIPVPPVPSVLLPLIILFGSSQIIMGSNRTRIWCKGISALTGEAEQAVGCCIFPKIPMSLNLQCWDFACKKYDVSIGAPMLSDVVFAPNTVQVGISFTDYLAAMIEWAIDIALAIFLAFGMKGLKKLWAKRAAAARKEAARLANKASQEAAAGELARSGRLKESIEAGQRAWDKVFAKETKPSFLGRLYNKIDSTPGGVSWLVGLGLKLPYRTLMKNTEWYREYIRKPIEKQL